MLAFIPSQANMAREDASANLPGAVAGTIAQLGIVYGTLYFGWDLIGLACSHLAATSIECSIKLAPAVVRAWQARRQTLPEAIVDRMVRFSRQGLALVAITVVLGSRTDLFFLKMLNTDERQISFFSTSMTLMERLVLLPESFAGAAGVSMMAQQGRDPQRLPALTALSSKYLLLVGMPMLVGASLVSQAIWAVFGPEYAPAAAVFSLLALFGCFRLLALPPQAMLQASENQRALVWFGLLGGMVNMAVDIALIPRFGALGAAIGFGTGQAILAASNWVQAWRLFGSGALPARGGAIVAAVALMAIATRTLMAREVSLANLAVTIGLSAVVYLAGIRGLRVLDGSDRARLSSLIPGSRGFSRALRSGIGAVTAE